MDDQRLIENIAKALGLPDRKKWDSEDLVGVFQMLRPEGNGIEEIFDTTNPVGLKLYDRMKVLYQDTASVFEPTKPYFSPRRSTSFNDENIVLRSHLNSLAEIAKFLGDDELYPILRDADIVRVSDPIVISGDGPDAWIHDMLMDFLLEIDCDGEEYFILEDAYYSIANNKMLMLYLMWPMYSDHFSAEDPFASYYQLWRHGVTYAFTSDETVAFK